MGIRENIDKHIEKLKRHSVSPDGSVFICACEILYKKYNIDITSHESIFTLNGHDWLLSALFPNTKEITILLKEWFMNPPPKKILDFFEKTIFFNRKYIVLKFSDLNKELVSLLMHFSYNIIDWEKEINDTRKRLNAEEESFIEMKKLVASKKIVKFIEFWMDDEFEMRPMRTRIALRKFEDLIKEK